MTESPIALGFSGGLDTSFCVPWLAEATRRRFVTVYVDTLGLDADARRFALELERGDDDWLLKSAEWGDLGTSF